MGNYKTILAVSEDPGLIRSLRSLLESRYRFLEAPDIETSRIKIDIEVASMVIIDVRISKEVGTGMYEEYIKSLVEKDILVHLLIEEKEAREVVNLIEISDESLGKPVRLDKLLSNVESLLHLKEVEGKVLRQYENLNLVKYGLISGGKEIEYQAKLIEDLRDFMLEMKAKMHMKNREIRKLNEQLEQKVEERTKQLREAQEDLVRKEKLAILGQLAGGVGHELRNPLGVINNAIYFLKTVMPDADETTKEYLNIIKDAVLTSERIISDLLDFSRTKTPYPELVTVNEMINQSLGKCVIPENITVHVDISKTLPMIKVDPLQMGQVFHNLIINAVQAMPDGGSLEISAEEDREANALRISVTDTGHGISPENMEKLFQPLFTTKAKGVGLGLVVSKRLTEANGGKIEVESQLGKGTTFTVILTAEM